MTNFGRTLMVAVGLLSALPVQAAPNRAAATASSAKLEAGTKPAIADDATVVLTGNIDYGDVYLIDPDTNRLLQTINIDAALPQMCSKYGCFFVGAHHTQLKGRDYVEVAVSSKVHQYGMIARLPLAAPNKPVWKLTKLDFSGVDSNGICPDEAADKNRPYFGCGVQLPHEVLITDENPDEKWVEMIIAEMTTSRIVKVHLDYTSGNTTGEVLWTLDTSVVGWDDTYYMPNYVYMADGPEGRFLLVTLVSQNSTVTWSSGRILMWDIGGSTPELQWEYPGVDAEGNEHYLNAVHGGTLQADPITGQQYLMYGHSLSQGSSFGVGEYGTIGIARVDDLRTLPTYLGDWQLPDTFEPFSFPRESEFLPDGSLFLTEGGCYYYQQGQECRAQNYWITMPNMPATQKGGSFSADHSDLNVVEIPAENVHRELSCGMGIQFEADVIPVSSFGTDLKAAYQGAGEACPAP